MAQTKFVFRVSVEVEYTAEEIKNDFDNFSEMSLEDIEKQLTWLCNEQGIIEVENDGRATEDAQNCVNDFIEQSLEVDNWEEVYNGDGVLRINTSLDKPIVGRFYQTYGGSPPSAPDGGWGGYWVEEKDKCKVHKDNYKWAGDWAYQNVYIVKGDTFLRQNPLRELCVRGISEMAGIVPAVKFD